VAENDKIIQFLHVDKVYPPNQQALRNVDFSVSRGEFVFLAGASGAGKSSLLKLLFAEERASRGELLVGGADVATFSSSKVAALRRSLGVIFQDYKLLENRTVIDNVAFALEVMGVRKHDRSALAFEMLSALGLGDRAHSYPQMLSGGEQQRVSIARALVNSPLLILADEPTGNLDPDMTRAVFDLLLEANRCGTTVLVATHDLALIEEMNRRTLVLDQGRLVGDFQNPGGQLRK
jgi:cell division transport system ATP-binding protein